MLRIEWDQQKTSFIYTASQDGETVATLTLLPRGENLFVHNTVSRWTPQLCKAFRVVFGEIQRQMRGLGFKLLITGSSCNERQAKREKYWRMMGFSIFTDTEVDGHKLRAAVLDLEG